MPSISSEVGQVYGHVKMRQGFSLSFRLFFCLFTQLLDKFATHEFL